MGIVDVAVLFLLFSHCVTPTTIISDKVKTNPSILATQCSDDSECPCSDVCSVCPTGWGPECETSACIRGRCGTVLTCSQPLSGPSSTVVHTKRSPLQQCTGSDISQCVANMICAGCFPGYSPGCTEAVCVNGQCKIISPCSIYTPTTTRLTTSRESACRRDNDCAYPGLCAAQCKAGFGPSCTSASCINGKCVVIHPCSVNTLVITTPTVSILPTTPSLSACQTDGQCAYVKRCVPECRAGFQPLCSYSRCIQGQCVVSAPCSQKFQCTEKDTSQCVVPPICAGCRPGFSPACAEASCDNGVCVTIHPCSIGRPTMSQPTLSTTVSDGTYGTDSDCTSKGVCVEQCKDGLGPLCPVTKYVNGKCLVVTPSCSQKPRCTEKDTSQCIVSPLCALCRPGFSPGCTEVSCENGQCKVIMPCTIAIDLPTRNTMRTTSTASRTTKSISVPKCTRSTQCRRRSVCVTKCSDDMTPLCASAKCVKGKCIDIDQCSQHICKTAATCPFNPKNCTNCAKGYGSSCEQAACKYGVCSVIAPCSKQLITMKPVQVVVNI